MRHTHVCRSKHIRAKNKQVSWNVDGTRHDWSSFDAGMSAIETAREIARQVLKLPSSVILEVDTLNYNSAALLTEAVRGTLLGHIEPVYVRAHDRDEHLGHH
jgi:hypothetical protein